MADQDQPVDDDNGGGTELCFEDGTYLLVVSHGSLNVPFWEYWTSPKKVAIIYHIPNGWVMFNGDI